MALWIYGSLVDFMFAVGKIYEYTNLLNEIL